MLKDLFQIGPIFIIKKVKNTVPWTYVINDLNGEEINVKVDLSNYATKTDLKNVDSSALKSNLANLKTEVDKLDIDKLTPVSNDVAKLSNVVKNDVVRKTEYNELVSKVNNIDTTGFVLKTTYDTDKSDLKKKISDADKKNPDTSDLAKKNRFKC